MTQSNNAQRGLRRHMVLVPGFVGFDALGNLPYYAGVTEYFQRWCGAERRAAGASIDYFDNFPTASVGVRAERLRKFLAKKWARGEIGADTELILAGHSTGGLDIRQLLIDLQGEEKVTVVDRDQRVAHESLTSLIKRVVFMSVPHYGTNLADYARNFEHTLQGFIKTLGIGLQLNREPVTGLRHYLQRVVDHAQSHLLLAVWDALNESDEDRQSSEWDRADERQARSEFALWLEHMGKDFGALADLSCFTGKEVGEKHPAHRSFGQRQDELDHYRALGLRSRSYVTRVSEGHGPALVEQAVDVGVATSAVVAPPLEAGFKLLNRAAESWYLPALAIPALLARGSVDSASIAAVVAALLGRPSLPFELAQAICGNASLPFRDPQAWPEAAPAPELLRRFGASPASSSEVEVTDSDGIVNSRSMLWPYDVRRRDAHEFCLVEADHGDIIGHHALKPVPAAKPRGRRYYAYDLLQSGAGFATADFERVWADVFEFAFS
jgi:triacylglycerol lipase